MEKIILKIKKKKCKGTCPIPLNLIPNAVRGIKKIDYNKRIGIAEIAYNNKLLSEKQMIQKIRKIGYEVKK